MTQLQLSGKETLLAISILAFVVIGIIVLFKFYFNRASQANLSKIHIQETNIDTLGSRVKYSEVNVFNWGRPIFLMGLCASICFTLFAFSWTTELQHEIYGLDLKPIEDIEIDVERTQHPKPTPPPPPPPPQKIEIPVDIIPEESIPEFIDESINKKSAVEIPFENTSGEKGTGEAKSTVAPPPPVYEEPPILIAEQMPRFPGCEDIDGTRKEKQKCAEKKLFDYIYAHLKYPKIAIENGIEGRATLRFVVDLDGRISDVKILQDIGGGCGKAAATAVESMNKMQERWMPGKQRGRPVRVLYTLPIQFKLN